MTALELWAARQPPSPAPTAGRDAVLELASLEDTENGFGMVLGSDWQSLGWLLWNETDGWHICCTFQAKTVKIRQARGYRSFKRIGVLEVRQSDFFCWHEFANSHELVNILQRFGDKFSF